MVNHGLTNENRTEKLRGVYKRVMSAAAHRHAKWWLAVVAFVESSVFLIPPDVMLIPMVLADRVNWWRIALISTIASVAGGLAGYAIGMFLFDTIGQLLLDFYSYGNRFNDFIAKYEKWGMWAVFGAGLTPFPYKVITIASGVARFDLLVFIISSTAARGLRFFLIAWLLYYFGAAISNIIEKYFGLITIALLFSIVACFFIIKFIF
jgi:membrane protein YqaA with SNARE-associated domain